MPGSNESGGFIILRSVKVFCFFVLALTISACSTFSGNGARRDGSAGSELVAARANALEFEVGRLKAENARLSNQVLDLQRENETLLAQAEPTDQIGDPDALREGSVQASNEIVVPTPQPQQNAVVDTANAPELKQSDVPVEEAPRLVQPTFASTEAVFENEAGEDEIATESVLFGVHLASYRNLPEAREGWQKLQRENPDELGLLEPRLETVSLPEKGVFLRLIGGGFSSEDKASALCASLKERDLYCSVSGFQGQKLSLAIPQLRDRPE